MIELWENIRTFYLIISLGSFKKAAIYLDLNSSTISRHISQLEELLGSLLFTSKNPIQLSLYGIKLFQYIYLPCKNLLNLSNVKHINEHSIPVFNIYVNDLYFFHLLLKIYDCQFIHEIITFNHISLNENDELIVDLMRNNAHNFIYITLNEQAMGNVAKNKQYIYWNIQNIPIYHFFANDYNLQTTTFLEYNGHETCLKNLHQHYISEHNIKSNNLAQSNSIDIIWNLLYCSGHSLLPYFSGDIIPNINGKMLNLQKVHDCKLFMVCHADDGFLKLIF